MKRIKVDQKRLINTFLKMVKIDSESGEEATFAKYVNNLAKKLEYTSKIDAYGNVIISVNGKTNEEPILLNTHMDTVVPGKGIRPKIKNINGSKYITSSGNTILGADPKATIAAIFEVLYLLKETNTPSRPFEISLTCQEETGIPTANKIKTNLKYCIVPDRGTPLGEYVTEAPFAQVFSVKVHGKKSYAYTEFEKGRHAILATNSLINSLKFGNISKNTVANIGIIRGGEMTSVVPDYAEIKASCYSFDKNEFDQYFDLLNKATRKTDKEYQTRSEIEMLEYFPGFSLAPSTPVVKLAKKAIQKTGFIPKHKKYMAVSNANLLNSIDIQTVLISYGAENQHTIEEKISIRTLEKLSEIILNTVI